MVNFEGDNQLDSILARAGVNKEFDLLSIDVNGVDYHIWKSLKRCRPKVLVIEYNPTIPNDVEFVQPADMSLRQGNSLLSLVKLGKEKGYELVAVTSRIGIFILKELFPIFEIKDNRLALMRYQSEWETRLFQLYDGTLVMQGKTDPVWRTELPSFEVVYKHPKPEPWYKRWFRGNRSSN